MAGNIKIPVENVLSSEQSFDSVSFLFIEIDQLPHSISTTSFKFETVVHLFVGEEFL